MIEQRERETLPRRSSNVDWGAERWVLARVEGRERPILFWVRGSTGWVSQGEQGYHPGRLVLQDEGDAYGRSLLSGGRLSKRRLQDIGADVGTGPVGLAHLPCAQRS